MERLLRSDNQSWDDFNKCFPTRDTRAKYICVAESQTLMFIMMYYMDFRQVGYWANPSNRGKGMGSNFLTICLNHIEKIYHPDALFAKVSKNNAASSKVALNSGFNLMTSMENDNLYVWYSS